MGSTQRGGFLVRRKPDAYAPGLAAQYRKLAVAVVNSASLWGHEVSAWPMPHGAIGAVGMRWTGGAESGDGRRSCFRCEHCRLACIITLTGKADAAATMETWMTEDCKPQGVFVPDRSNPYRITEPYLRIIFDEHDREE